MAEWPATADPLVADQLELLYEELTHGRDDGDLEPLILSSKRAGTKNLIDKRRRSFGWAQAIYEFARQFFSASRDDCNIGADRDKSRA